MAEEIKKPNQKSLKTDTKVQKSSLKAILYVVIFILILGGLGYGGYSLYKVYTYKPTAPSSFSLKIKENQAIVDQIEKTQEFGQKVSTSEPGYGRPDPFAPF